MFFCLHQFPATGPYGLWPEGKKLMIPNPPSVEKNIQAYQCLIVKFKYQENVTALCLK